MRRPNILIFVLFSFAHIYGQKEANHWFFGVNSGLKFNESSMPTPITGSLNTIEGCSSISDREGNLLFYTDGIKVWDRYHNQMPNGYGLLGFPSSTHSALIVKQPGSESTFYIFTADGLSFSLNHYMENGYRYTIVDMTLNGGLGDVTSKNNLLYAPSSEKLAAVKHGDGVSIWIMTHEWASSKYKAYLLDCNGLNANPAISDVGTKIGLYPDYWMDVIGQMKFSPNGKKLGIVIQGQIRPEILDFDHNTGILSNPQKILAYWPDNYLQPDGSWRDFENIYGLEFSPNSKMVYLSQIGGGYFFQYDISSGNSLAMSATGYFFGFSGGPWCDDNLDNCYIQGGLQLGPDGRIYKALKDAYGLDVVDKPNFSGAACNYIKSPLLVNKSWYGLPTFCASYFDPEPIFIDSSSCLDVYLKSNFESANSYHWDFGDLSTTNDFSSNPSPNYTYPNAGSYEVVLIVTNSSGCADTIKKVVKVTCDELFALPNVITANDDGNNDFLFIEGIEAYPDNEVKIFDRWGIELFYKKGYSNLNAFSCNNCSEGVYFGVISIPSINYKKDWFFHIFH